MATEPDDDDFNTAASTENNQLPGHLVFYRYRQNYDESQGRFLSPWRARHVTWAYFEPVSTSTDTASSDNLEDDATFSVQWSRCPTLPQKQWIDDATYLGTEVIGEITAFFPSIFFFGP